MPSLPNCKELEKALARRSLIDFYRYIHPDYEIKWFHEIICDYLEQWAFGNIKRLMIFMPPGTGKSDLGSRVLPAWIFGRNPDAWIMATSYSPSLASDMNRDVQKIIESEEYKEIFPETTLFGKNIVTVASNTYLRNSEVFQIVNHDGYYKCAGVQGAITGKRFFYGIIDDPLKGRETAESPTMREKLHAWYRSDFHTRVLNKDARILIIQTRWHMEDLAGMLMEQARQNPKAEQWEVVSFPMIAEDDKSPFDPRKTGESLWPSRFGTAEELETEKITQGPYNWSSLFQQHPTPPGGAIFNRGWWKYWGHEAKNDPFTGQQSIFKRPDYKDFDLIIQSWDCTFKDTKGTDYVVAEVWGKKNADRYLLDIVRARMDFPTTIQAVRSLSGKWPCAIKKLVEDKANGPAVISTLQREIPGLIPFSPGTSSKIIRAQAITPYVQAGNVFIPDPSIHSWVHDFIEECAAFPNGKNDDQVDAMTQALIDLNAPTVEPSQWMPPEKTYVGAAGYSGIY